MRRKLLAAVLYTLAILMGAIIGTVFHASETVIHPKQEASPYDCRRLRREEVRFESRDGLKLAGWFVSGGNGGTVVLAHGRGGYKDWMCPHARYLNGAGFSVLLFDFRYRGESEGDAQTLGYKEAWDILSAVEYLARRREVDPDRIGVQGNSLGAASAILAAAEGPEIRGVVAEIPFTGISDILCHSFEKVFSLPCFPLAHITKWLSEIRLRVDLDRVSAVEVIGDISPRPVFLIDDGHDDLFPPDSVERLRDAAAEPKQYWNVAEALHGKGWETMPEEYERRVIAFWRKTFELTGIE